jgi:hypothetical protein
LKVYRGERTAAGALVTVDGLPLTPRPDLFEATSGGFEWGYDGSGPLHLALAILADHYGDDRRALADGGRFLRAYIAPLATDRWSITGTAIAELLGGYVEVPLTLEELLSRARRGQ